MQCLSDGLILASADDSVALVSHGMIRKVKILAHVHVFGSCTCVLENCLDSSRQIFR